MHLSNANNERELLAHLSDDDRDRGLRKPKSSGFFGLNLGRGTKKDVDADDHLLRITTTRGRSIPQQRNKQQQQQHVDVELVDLLAQQLRVSEGEKARRSVVKGRGTGTGGHRDTDQHLLLNDSSVQLLLHDEPEEEEAGGSSSSSSSCGSVSSDEDQQISHESSPHIIIKRQSLGVDDLLVGSKFARQLSKSHSVVVEEDLSYHLGASAVFEGAKKKKKKASTAVVAGQKDKGNAGGDHQHCSVQEVTSSDEDEENECWHDQRHGEKSSVVLLPESPTRFCFVDGTKQVSVRDTVLRYCDQTEPLRFADVYSERVLRQCRKVGEGVYSEVFMYRQFEVDPATGQEAPGKAIVLKVIPIEGELIVNGEVQKKFDEILSEIIISKELSDLRYDTRNKTSGFVNVERVRCVKGRYPSYLVDLWDLYNDNHGSDNDHPEVFDDEQLFIVLELENAGQDLEAFNFTNAVQGHAAFLQTVLTLAVAETKYEFEHRDLHWGNILLRHTDEKEAVFVLNGKRITVPTEGVQVTIIDYTLSRMLYKRNYLQFNDLAHDEDLFSATGDYQYEIYRLMRKRLANVWSSFEPYTNVLWLHYMIDKLINGARYRLKASKKHKAAIKQMMDLRDDVPDYKSSADLVAKLFGC